ncbi:1a protein [Sambucus virus S]|uniref:Replication protein 1a n=1 Tax=Sambucus virus S TaxID=2052851 RepID=A0A2D3FAG3_9BROM|nr:1a protein [Sambucus virus S]ATU46942.1 1a protein [Sambucus virus S]
MDLSSLIAERGAMSRGAEDIVNDQVTRQLLEQVEHAKRSKTITVRNKMTPAETDAFRARYGGAFSVNLTQEYDAPHSLAGALRIAEHYDCLGQFPAGDAVCDFGGSYWHHYSRGDHRVHSCCPVLGLRDAARHEERLCRMRRLLETKHEDVVPNFCLNKAEDCKHQADWAICIHGGYDMGFQGLCNAMKSHGVRILRGTIMFDGAMLFDKEGVMPLLNCRWKRVGEGSKEVVKFDFMNESTLSYVHTWANLRSFYESSVAYVGGTTYLLEREVLRCNIMTYKIIATNLRVPRETLRHCVWFENISNYVYVKIPEEWNLLKWKNVRVAKTTVREVEEISFRCFKDNKEWTENLKAVASVLSAKSSTVIINGQAIMAGERLEVSEYHFVAFALTLNLYQKYERLKEFYDDLEWKGWFNHFKTRLWWGGDVSIGGPGKVRAALASTFPFLKLDSYKDSLTFLSKISDVKEFECDSVPVSRLRSLLGGEDLLQRAVDELNTAKTKKEKKRLEQQIRLSSEEAEIFEDASDEIPPLESVCDDVKQAAGPAINGVMDPPESSHSVRDNLDPRMVSRTGALREYKEYCERLHENTSSNLRQLWTLSGAKAGQVHNMAMIRTYQRVDDMINVHKPDGTWAFPLKYEYVVGYNEKGLGPKFDNELYLVDKTCLCSNQEALAKACQDVSVPNCEIRLCDGVAGCGKTTAIKNAFQFEEDVVVTANRKSADDVRKALFPKNPNTETALRYIRTADSALMHGLPPCKRLLIDEAGLMHYGQLLAVTSVSRCNQVLAFGDTEQISFKSRDADFRMTHNKLEYDHREVTTDTYRCPQDVVAAVKNLKKKCGNRHTKYESWRSKSKVEKSLSKRSITSVNQISIEADKFYLTMTQADKAALQTRAKDFPVSKEWVEENIKTVHEAQGISVKHVVLVRLKSIRCDLFKDQEYCLVALTRHTVTFEYLYNGKLGGDLIDACV